MADQFNPYREGENRVKDFDLTTADERFREYRHKWETYPKERIVGDFPIHVDLELASMCNLRCPMCHTLYIDYPSFEAYQRGDAGSFMPFETFKRAIEEAVGHRDFSSIKLNFRGEATLHPEIDKCIAYAKERGVFEVLLNSNGNYPIELNKKLVDAGLSEISYSFDAISPQTYKKIRVGGDYYVQMRNAMDMLRYRDKIRVCVSFVHQKANAHEVDDFVKFWTNAGAVRIFVSDVYNPGELIPADTLAVRKYRKRATFTCPQLWQRLTVLHNGDVYPCCHSFEEPAELRLGNVHEQSLASMWHGEKLKEIRQVHAEGRYYEFDACYRCSYPKAQIAEGEVQP